MFCCDEKVKETDIYNKLCKKKKSTDLKQNCKDYKKQNACEADNCLWSLKLEMRKLINLIINN